MLKEVKFVLLITSENDIQKITGFAQIRTVGWIDYQLLCNKLAYFWVA
jgi:hypothetical protein